MKNLDEDCRRGYSCYKASKKNIPLDLTFHSNLLPLPSKTPGYVFGFLHQGKFARSPLVKILLVHSLISFISHVIRRWQHSIEGDVDLHVVIECLQKKQVFYDGSKQINIET